MKTTIPALLLFALPAFGLERPKLQIINTTPNAVEVFWEMNDGHRVSNGMIEPGKDKIIGTTIGHRFVIVDGTKETDVVSSVRVQGFRYDPSAKDGVPTFYTQRASAGGFPIVASAKVSPFAVKEAEYLVNMMLAKRADVRDAMVASGARLCIMAHNEFTMDLPEFGHLGAVKGFEAVTPKEYWDARARGLGGSETDPFCSCAEENLLAYDGDPYDTENILIHEFAHNMHLRGMVNVDPTFDTRLKSAYNAAMKAGLWTGAYASTNHHEYFAEGVQSWFDNNRQNDAQHNHVDTRDELTAYDPGLAAICREVFGDTVLKYTKPQTRLTGHLAGYDPSKAPKFVWPDRLMKARGSIKKDQLERFQAATSRKERDTRMIAGWTVHVSTQLIEQDAALLEKAMQLLRAQFDEIVRVVPAKAVAELQKVPLWINPEYPHTRPRAEYHPGAGWLRENKRDPVMAKAVEFTNVRIFEEETRRMPNFALHELAHAFHDRVLGFNNAEIAAVFEKAKAAGKYDKVERHDSQGRKRLDRAYAMTNAKEYFAECSEAFFSRNDFFPFTKEELKQHDPDVFALLERLWNMREM
jgi:Mlc titration factor MtfA (ptsG expression regulator)